MGAIAITTIMVDMAYGVHYGISALLVIGFLLAACEINKIAKGIDAGFSLPALIVSGSLLLAWNILDNSPFEGQALESLRALPITMLLLALGFSWMCLAHLRQQGHAGFLRSLGMGSFSLVYLIISCSCMIILAALPDSADTFPTEGQWVNTRGHQLWLLLCATCKLGDVGAFFGGRALGKKKLAPKVSPGKTWAGFYCAFLGAIGGAYLFYGIYWLMDLPLAFSGWWQPLVWGFVLAPIGVLGDLVESCIKREADIKDSGSVLPGFGGFLDVFDAIIFAAPFALGLALILP